MKLAYYQTEAKTLGGGTLTRTCIATGNTQAPDGGLYKMPNWKPQWRRQMTRKQPQTTFAETIILHCSRELPIIQGQARHYMLIKGPQQGVITIRFEQCVLRIFHVLHQSYVNKSLLGPFQFLKMLCVGGRQEPLLPLCQSSKLKRIPSGL